MGRNTKYSAKIGLAELLELAMMPSAATICKKDFLRSTEPEFPQTSAPELSYVAPQ